VNSPRIFIRKRELEVTLQSIVSHAQPKIDLEQYTTPADLAANLLYTACYVFRDIKDKTVIDLGTGTGRLAIGAAILGARSVVGIDIDAAPLHTASQNSKRMDLEVDWVLGDIDTIRSRFDTVIMNPPFGTKHRHADVRFLRAAMKIGEIIYSIHKSATYPFLSRWLSDHDAECDVIMKTMIPITHQFDFHRKRSHLVAVNVLRIMLA